MRKNTETRKPYINWKEPEGAIRIGVSPDLINDEGRRVPGFVFESHHKCPHDSVFYVTMNIPLSRIVTILDDLGFAVTPKSLSLEG